MRRVLSMWRSRFILSARALTVEDLDTLVVDVMNLKVSVGAGMYTLYRVRVLTFTVGLSS